MLRQIERVYFEGCCRRQGRQVRHVRHRAPDTEERVHLILQLPLVNEQPTNFPKIVSRETTHTHLLLDKLQPVFEAWAGRARQGVAS
jgi:hypothetical protein